MATHQMRDGRIVETVRSSIFRCTPDRSLDRLFLRHCAVRRLYERGHICAEKAADLLLCKPALRRAVVATWTDLAGDPA